MDIRTDSPRPSIRAELQAARADFHGLLASLSEQDCRRASLNPGWTNGEILAHMLFGFIILNVLLPLARLWGRLPPGSSRGFASLLNALTGPFNRFNALGARMQGRVFTYRNAGDLADRFIDRLLRQLDTVRDEEWQYGMHYPTRWDPSFSDFMTLEKLFRYPVTHFYFHVAQISRRTDTS